MCDDGWEYNVTTKRLTHLNNEGGESHQTVNLVTQIGDQKYQTKQIEYNGTIQRMFDFTVFGNPKADNIVFGGLQSISGLYTAVRGIAEFTTGEFTLGLTSVLGAYNIVDGGYNVSMGLKRMFESQIPSSVDIIAVCHTGVPDVLSSIDQLCRSFKSNHPSISPAKIMKSTIKQGGTLAISVGEVLMRYNAMQHPSLRPQFQNGNYPSDVTTIYPQYQQFDRRVGLPSM